ncbi:hypothetical protein DFH09DRAFT_1328217 [Mycena vulgaris]|nr:hypothetical protein DFH09DRAFT_1328217 [Mycena vulgaris]
MSMIIITTNVTRNRAVPLLTVLISVDYPRRRHDITMVTPDHRAAFGTGCHRSEWRTSRYGSRLVAFASAFGGVCVRIWWLWRLRSVAGAFAFPRNQEIEVMSDRKRDWLLVQEGTTLMAC